jgi:hypothetical protein
MPSPTPFSAGPPWIPVVRRLVPLQRSPPSAARRCARGKDLKAAR